MGIEMLGKILEIELKVWDSPVMFDDTIFGSLIHFQIFILNIKRNHLQVITKNHRGIPQFTGSTFNLKPQIMQIHSKGSLFMFKKKQLYNCGNSKKNLWVGGKTIENPNFSMSNGQLSLFPFFPKVPSSSMAMDNSPFSSVIFPFKPPFSSGCSIATVDDTVAAMSNNSPSIFHDIPIIPMIDFKKNIRNCLIYPNHIHGIFPWYHCTTSPKFP